MTGESTIICPACGVPTPPGNFCEFCQADLTGSPAKAPPSPPATDGAIDDGVVAGDGGESAWRNLDRLSPEVPVGPPMVAIPPLPDLPPVPIPPVTPLVPPVGNGEPITVKINELEFFLVDIASSFSFFIEPLTADARHIYDLSLTLAVPGREPVVERRKDLFQTVWYVNFLPTQVGVNMRVDFVLTFMMDDMPHEYRGEFLYDCYPPDQSSGKIIENLTVKVHDLCAKDVAEQQTYIKILEGFTPQTADSLQQQMRQLKLRPLWQLVPMQRMFSDTVQQVMIQALPGLKKAPVPTDRLTLRNHRKRLHILYGETMAMGRHKAMDIVTRVYDAHGKLNKTESLNISAAHARFFPDAGRIWLADGGFDPNRCMARESTTGTFFNGKRVAYTDPEPLPLDVPFRLTLGGLAFTGQLYSCGALGGGNGCGACTGIHQPAALILERQDKRPDVYCLLYCLMALRYLDAEFDREYIVRKHDGFVLAYPRGPRMAVHGLNPKEVQPPGLPPGWTVGPYLTTDA